MCRSIGVLYAGVERVWNVLIENLGIERVWNVGTYMERPENHWMECVWNRKKLHERMWNVLKILGDDVYGTLERVWDVWNWKIMGTCMKRLDWNVYRTPRVCDRTCMERLKEDFFGNVYGTSGLERMIKFPQ